MTVTTDLAQWIYLLWGLCLLLLLAVLCWNYFRMAARVGELQASVDQQRGEIHALQRVLRGVHDDGNETREAERELAERVELLSRQQEQLLLRDADTGPYFQAIRQAGQGAGVEELMERAGVSRVEAELILRLHAPGTRD